MKTEISVRPSESLRHVRYEIRGGLARRAHEMARMGYEIISLNIGNPGAFGFRTPETMRLAMIANLSDAGGYCHQKGIFPAREAAWIQQQGRGVTGWTADVEVNGGRAIHYARRPENGFVQDTDEVAASITLRTRAIGVINHNNPTGAVYSRSVLESLARLAERNGLVVFADEIYDQMLYDGAEFVPMATIVRDTLCATLSGLSKIYRACGYRVGWVVFSGRVHAASEYLSAL